MPGVKAGEAFVDILARTTKFEKSLKRAQARLKSFGQGAVNVGLKVAGIGTAIAAPFVFATKKFADFENGLSKVGALVDFNRKLMEGFKDSIQSLSIEFGESTDVLVAGLFDIISSGKPASEAIKILTASVKLAKAGFTDTAIATQALTRVMDAYDKSADEAVQITDDLVTIAKLAVTDLGKFAPVIGKVASTASILGVSFAELGAAFTAVSKDLSTDESITALNGVLGAFLKPSKEGSEQARKLGFELSVAGLKAEGFVGVIEKLSRADPDLIGKIIPEKSAIRGILSLTKDLEGLRKNIGKIESSGGAVSSTISKISGDLSFLGNQIKSISGVLLQVIGESLAPDVKKLGDSLKNVAKGLLIFVKENKVLIPQIVKLVASVGLLAAGLISLGLAASFSSLIFGGLAGILTGFTVVVAAIFSPIGILIGLIGALAVAVENKFSIIKRSVGVLKEQFSDLLVDAKVAFGGIVKAIKAGEIEAAFKIVTASLELLWTKLTGKLSILWENMRAAIIKTTVGIGTSIIKIFIESFAGLKLLVENITSFFTKVWFKAISGVFNMLLGLQGAFEKAFIKLKSFKDRTINVVAEFKRVDEEVSAIQKRNLTKRDEKIDEEKRDSKKSSSRIVADANATLAVISKISNEIKIGTKEKVSERVATAQSELDKARDSLKSIVSDIDKQTSDVEGPYERRLRERRELKEAAALPRKIQRFQGFNPFAVERRTFQDDIQRKSLKAAEETAKNTKDIKRAQGQGAVFA